jgi:hypothetical protein
MIETIIISLILLLLFGVALAFGQFFGRPPIKPKCNPDDCCMQGSNCREVGDLKSEGTK